MASKPVFIPSKETIVGSLSETFKWGGLEAGKYGFLLRCSMTIPSGVTPLGIFRWKVGASNGSGSQVIGGEYYGLTSYPSSGTGNCFVRSEDFFYLYDINDFELVTPAEVMLTLSAEDQAWLIKVD